MLPILGRKSYTYLYEECVIYIYNKAKCLLRKGFEVKHTRTTDCGLANTFSRQTSEPTEEDRS